MANQPTKYKKFLAGAASATLVATAIVPTALAAETAAADFSDVAATHTHYANIMQAVERGLFNGYTDGTFKPENTIDRKGVVKSLANYVVSQSNYKTYEEYISAKKLTETVKPFNDVPATHGDAELFNASLIVKDSGIFTGSNNNLMPANVITRQQMAKVLVNGFGLKDLAGVESKVTDNDKAQDEYVTFINILSENGVTEVTAFNPTGAVKRGQMASFLNRAYDSAHKVVDPETATKVVSVSATNLVQAVVTFDGSVDKATAEDHDNYTIVEADTNTTKDVKSAVLSADGKSVTLTLDAPNDAAEFVNQEKYELNFNNVKAGDKVLNVKDYEFTPVDAALPTVEAVEALGNKTIRVVFSEPVQKATPANFLVDGNTLIGNTKVSGNTVIVKLFNTLTDGEHKVSVTGVEDHAGFKSLNKEVAFNVVKDETAPTASVESATFEHVTVKFSEAVDPETVLASNVYWMQGSSKKNAKAPVVQLSDDTFRFDFSDNKIQYKTDLYITGVKDYSGNAIAADTKVQVNPVLDQTNPTVINAELQNDLKTINVKFSKALEAASVAASDFVVKDADGKEYSKLKTVTLPDNKTVKVVLATALEEGETYTLEISGINDNTTLKNPLLPYKKELTVGDESAPELALTGAVVRNVANNSIVVTYPEVMSTSGDGSIVDRTKYSYKTATGEWKTLPASANLNVTSDGKSAVIGLPSSIKVADVTNIRVQLVKDAAGNFLKGLTQERAVADATDVALESAFATSKTSITADFDANLLSSTVTASDFTVTNAVGVELSVIGAALSSSDSSRVVLTLADSSKLNENGTHADNRAVTVKVKANATTSTPAGKAIKTDAVGKVVDDKIKATIDKVTGLANGSIQLTFNEALNTAVDKDNAEFDLVIKDGSTTLTPGTHYNIDSISGNDVVISFTSDRAGIVSVALPAPRVLEDNATVKNVVAVSDTIEVEVKALDVTGPTVTGVTNNQISKTDLTPVVTDAASITLKKDAAAAAPFVSGTVVTAEGTYVLTATDAVGNVTTVNFVIDKTAPVAAVLANLTVAATTVTGNAAAVEAGSTVKIVADGAASTTAAQGSGTSTAIANGSFPAITGLTTATAYDVYVIDAAGNVSAKLDITTP